MGMAPRFPVTRHGQVRLAQRGIDPAALDLLLLWGRDIPAGRGCVRRILLHEEAVELLAEGIAPSLVEATARLEAVVAEDGCVVTAYTRAPEGVRPSRRCRLGRSARGRRR